MEGLSRYSPEVRLVRFNYWQGNREDEDWVFSEHKVYSAGLNR
jgi:hypothetical protein